MSSFKVKVKWGKETFTDVEINTAEPPLVFKAQLFALTGVQPDRQKVMVKGVTVKDEDWNNVKLKNGSMILMMGTCEELPSEPVEKTVFLEDMSENELATALDLPAGLTNLGNTCYLNATIQCLNTVPEMRESLKRYKEGLKIDGMINPSQSITAALRDLYDSMDKQASVAPLMLLQVLHMAFPRFSEKSEHGGFMQQDANECWTEVTRMLQQKLVTETCGNNFIDKFFGGSFDVSLKCTDAEDEPVNKSTENFLQLSCFISQDVKYMHSGLLNRMEEHLTKHSSSLNRDAVYKKTLKIKRLPAYLTIQFVRFFYKEKEGVNAKILKDVKFPLNLDVFDLCSSELQEKLVPMRTKFKEQEDRLAEKLQKGNAKTESEKKKDMKKLPFSFSDDEGSNNSGYYELQAVLTHKGRSSSSGHYVGWVRHKKDEWVKCDDDKISVIPSEDVLKLSGGGDWHCAYVLLYGPRIFEMENEEEQMMETS